MKTKILSMIAAVAFVMGLAACNDDNWNPKVSKDGSVRLSSMDVEVSTAQISRADVDLSSFLVDIVDADGITKESWKYSSMPEIITLAVGDYKVVVRSHEVQKQEWENRYFLGSKTFSIKENQITEIGAVVCTIANVAVNISYDDELLALLGDDCLVVVETNNGGMLEFTPAEKRTGYFEVVEGSTTLVSTFSGTVSGAFTTIRNQYTDVAGGKRYNIRYSLKATPSDIPVEQGQVDPTAGISVNTTIDEEDVKGNVNTGEEIIDPGTRPGTEEPETPQTPDTPDTPGPGENNDITFTSSTLDFQTENSVDVESAIVTLNSVNGFSHLYVKIESDNADFIASAGELLPLDFDLANAGESAEALASIGLPVGPYPADQVTMDFNISDLVPLLAAFPGHHSFSLTVVDNKGTQKSLTLKFLAD